MDKVKVKFSLVQGIMACKGGGIPPLILNLITRWGDWLASPSCRFNVVETADYEAE